MLQQLVQLIERISSIPILVALTLVSILFPAVLFPLHKIGDSKLLDLHFSYSSVQVYEHLAALGEEGRNAYICMALTSDLVFPICYSLVLSVALIMVLKNLFPPACRFRYLCLFPFLIVIFDWCENLSLAYITNVFPKPVGWIINFSSFFTSLKWSLVLLSVMMLFIVIIIQIISLKRGK